MNEYKTKYLDTEGEESGRCGLVQGWADEEAVLCLYNNYYVLERSNYKISKFSQAPEKLFGAVPPRS